MGSWSPSRSIPKAHAVRKGRYTVSDFKRLAGVDPNDQLAEVVYGQFVELKDSEKVSIEALFCGAVMEFPEGRCATAVDDSRHR